MPTTKIGANLRMARSYRRGVATASPTTTRAMRTGGRTAASYRSRTEAGEGDLPEPLRWIPAPVQTRDIVVAVTQRTGNANADCDDACDSRGEYEPPRRCSEPSAGQTRDAVDDDGEAEDEAEGGEDDPDGDTHGGIVPTVPNRSRGGGSVRAHPRPREGRPSAWRGARDFAFGRRRDRTPVMIKPTPTATTPNDIQSRATGRMPGNGGPS